MEDILTEYKSGDINLYGFKFRVQKIQKKQQKRHKIICEYTSNPINLRGSQNC